jgi:mono/diheme cytochrome c family protein
MSRRAQIAMMTALVAAAGCSRRMDMYDQPRYEAQEASRFFADGKAARDPVPGTVARGWLRADAHFYRGRIDDSTLAPTFPAPVTHAVLARGSERYGIYCTPCHDAVGAGRGMVVRRGFKQPPSFHVDRLRDAAPGYLFDVVTNGFGTMSGYASQIPVEDRWAIVAYVRALQLSQNVRLAELAPAERARIEAAIRAAASHPHQSPSAGGHP